jgi:hypothetical protein
MIDRGGFRDRWLAGALVIGLTAACSPADGPGSPVGVWSTASIGEFEVPGAVEYDGARLETTYARWAFFDDGVCVLTQLVDRQVRTFDRCTYTVNAGDGTFAVSVLAGQWTGTVRGRTVALVDPLGITWELEAP